jgi:hypothetical protein
MSGELTEQQRATLRAQGFQPGQSGNPGGKPAKARNRLQGKFLNALADDFEEHGRKAIERCREEDPPAYLRAIVALMPKELEISRQLDDLSDDELDAALVAARALAAARNSGSGADAAPGVQSTAGIPSVPEAG